MSMKRVRFFLMSGMMVLGMSWAVAQKMDDERMQRDIAVSENALSTLIRQEFDKRNFFPMEVKGNYVAGYGVTFTIPTTMFGSVWSVGGGANDIVVLDGTPGAYSYSWSIDEDGEVLSETISGDLEKERMDAEIAMKKADKEMKSAKKEMELAEKERRAAGVRAPKPARIATRSNSDSLQKVANTKIISAAKNFIADYGDMISQLQPNERIVISNRGEGQFMYYGQNNKRSLLSVEALKSDLTQFRQGKINREQMIAKIKVTNTESSGKAEPDMELLTSIFSRLYSSDLSNTFYTQGNVYYERLTDFGAIVYMQVYSSNQIEDGLFNMPTVDLREVDQAERDKKVKELYPIFESDLKENILDYARTIKSLEDNEQLVFNVKLTKCKGCGIPADIEVSVKNSVLKDYSSGKLDKSSALGKITVKKGPGQ
jgi:hypothetical protein